MQTKRWTYVDKSKWRDGPWKAEIDKKQWLDEETGLPCLIVRGPSGALCGYVGVGKSHPFFEKDYSTRIPVPDRSSIEIKQFSMGAFLEAMRDDDGHASLNCIINVHGGLTFSDHCCPSPSGPGGICHVVEEGEDDNVWWLGFDCAHAGDVCPAYETIVYPGDEDVYRELDYVAQQVQ